MGKNGPEALSAPGDDSRKVYYKVDDIYRFMGSRRMRVIELTLSSDKLALFGFLKSPPAQVSEEWEYFKFIYFEPDWRGADEFPL